MRTRASDMCAMLSQAYGTDAAKKSTVFEAHKPNGRPKTQRYE